MDLARFRQIDNVLQAALSRPLPERDRFVAEACADDEALRRDVEALLDSSRRSGLLDIPLDQIASECLVRPDARLASGQRLGPYDVHRLLAAGGMGEVYLAEDSRLGRRVALKLLSATWTDDPQRISRFELEARAASALNHPNIVIVHDVGVIDGFHFIAAEYVPGQTLRERLANGPLALPEALRIARQIGSGLAAAHAAGIVHRDLKPENIIVRDDGVVKIVDFGLAKLFGPSEPSPALSPDSLPGLIVGTTAYMSPEQAQGLKVDARSDIFSLGVVLFELIVGRVPFSGSTAPQMMASILRDDAPAASRHRNDVPKEVDRVLRKALQKDPRHRYATVEELLSDLGDVTHARRVRAPLVAAVVVVAAAAFAGIVRTPLGSAPIDSVAILPFTVPDDHAEMRYIVDGLTEGVTRRLSALPQLRVVSGPPDGSRPGGRAQRAGDSAPGAVLRGHVLARGVHLSVHVELTDDDGRPLWAADYDRPASELGSIQALIAADTIEGLHLRLTDDERRQLTRLETINTDAFQAYLKGRYFWSRRTVRDLETSIKYFEQAVALDPKYPLAQAGRADAYLSLGGGGGTPKRPRREDLGTAKQGALTALALDPNLVEAHVSLATVLYWLDWNWSGAEAAFNRALTLNPRYPVAHHRYGVFLAFMGRFDEAIAELNRAVALDPVSVGINADFGLVYYFAHRPDEAIVQTPEGTRARPGLRSVSHRPCRGAHSEGFIR